MTAMPETATLVQIAAPAPAEAPPPAHDPAATQRLELPPTPAPAPARLTVTVSLPIWFVTALPGVLALVLALVAMARVEPLPAAASYRTLSPTPPLVVPTAAHVAQIGPVLPLALTAYAAPGGEVLGALPAGRAYTVLGEAHGGAWLQIDAGSGPVWVAASDWGASPVVRPGRLPDLTPPTPVPTAPPPLPTRVPAAPAPAAAPPAGLQLAPTAPAETTCLDAAGRLCHRAKPSRHP